jgi:DNA (cytosine-5)-methyltransferase 1
MNHGSLFSGIGGFDLASEWMGWENKFHCEWNPFGQKVLKHYWPNAVSYNDITKSDFTIHRGSIDILTGGFPCQPYSSAGKRLGKDDDRHLWPEMLRAIREIQPTWIVGENVRGLTNWNGGLVFDEVQSEMESQGYEVTPFLLPACAVNAPHRRDRIWFIAHAKSNGSDRASRECSETAWRSDIDGIEQFIERGQIWDVANATSERLGEKRSDISRSQEWSAGISDERLTSYSVHRGSQIRRTESPASISRPSPERHGNTNDISEAPKRSAVPGWIHFPTQSPVCSGNDGISSGLDGITFSKWRNESIKAAGNAIVPQVAYQIFQAIQQYQSNNL